MGIYPAPLGSSTERIEGVGCLTILLKPHKKSRLNQIVVQASCVDRLPQISIKCSPPRMSDLDSHYRPTPRRLLCSLCIFRTLRRVCGLLLLRPSSDFCTEPLFCDSSVGSFRYSCYLTARLSSCVDGSVWSERRQCCNRPLLEASLFAEIKK